MKLDKMGDKFGGIVWVGCIHGQGHKNGRKTFFKKIGNLKPALETSHMEVFSPDKFHQDLFMLENKDCTYICNVNIQGN